MLFGYVAVDDADAAARELDRALRAARAASATAAKAPRKRIGRDRQVARFRVADLRAGRQVADEDASRSRSC